MTAKSTDQQTIELDKDKEGAALQQAIANMQGRGRVTVPQAIRSLLLDQQYSHKAMKTDLHLTKVSWKL